jgi:alkanesulfonate monooxygenase SsuD/methylene tetrahydromethanopterin reductase-like flavin-dependent oxidoreductase (luciferase family)
VRFGILILPEDRWSIARERWIAAEQLGFDHAWTYDHLTWRSLRDGPWFAAVPTLAAAAGVTEHIRLGTLVASPNFRHPVPFAKELMSLDDVSNGRITLGIGAGGEGWDATALGQSAWTRAERTERFEEFIRLLDQLLVQRETSYKGRFYSAVEARAIPGCVQRPRLPFAVAASGPRSMLLAAELAEAWVNVDGRDIRADQIARLEDTCASRGRDPATIARMALLGFSEHPLASVEAFRDVAGRYGEMGFSDVIVHWPRPDEPFEADIDLLESIAAEIPALRSF